MNLVVVLVPAAGLEFADIYERQLLNGLEREMRSQAVLARRMIEEGIDRGLPLDDPGFERVVTRAAEDTRMRLRILGPDGEVALDSHAQGPPEGPEPPAPTILPTSRRGRRGGGSSADVLPDLDWRRSDEVWPRVPHRREVREALSGQRSAYTRVRARAPAVILFLTEPILHDRRVAGVVYVTRSTQPVLVELYRIRTGLFTVLAGAMVFTLLVTLLLAGSISFPLSRLSKAARRIARGERDVPVPVSGGGEIRELGESFRAMTEELDARLRYISDFAADVAHEFKSPLTSIRGAAELLGEGAADDPEARARFLRNIELDTERLDRLVTRLLELSRVEASDEPPAPVDLSALLGRAADRVAGPDVTVAVRYRAGATTVEARATDLETAMLNLLDNAVRFSPSGAEVTVDVDDDPRPGFVRIVVTDQGPGIPPAHLPRIWERFFTTEADGEGTGLGLAIVRAVVLAHGGAVDAESAPGRGTRFTVRLPVRRGGRRR